MSAPSDLRALRPTATALRLGDSLACPIELGQLLAALGQLRLPLICFRPTPEALSSTAAGFLRAAKQRQAPVALLLDLSEQPPRSYSAALAAVGSACDETGYDLPMALLAKGPSLGGAVTEALAAFVAEALEAGFPTPFLEIEDADVAAEARAEALAAISEPARERELGWALSVGPHMIYAELAALLDGLARRGASPAVVRSAAWEPGKTPPAFIHVPLWILSHGRERPDERASLPPSVVVVGAPLEQLAGARGERAEAQAYFAAEAALSAWPVTKSAARLAATLMARWQE